MALRRVARSPASAESPAPAAPRLILGTAMAAMIPMITTTITSSIRLKPRRARFLGSVRTISTSGGYRPHRRSWTLELSDHRHAALAALDAGNLRALRGRDRPHTRYRRFNFPRFPP